MAALALAAAPGCTEPAAGVDAPAAVGALGPASPTHPSPSGPGASAQATRGAGRLGLRRLRLVAAGDVAFGRYRMGKQLQRVPRRADPFAEVAALVQAADVALANLETPMAPEPAELRLTRAAPGRNEDPDLSLSFRAEPADAALLAAAGFTHLSIANNHILDMGRAAAVATREHLAAAGLVGLGCAATLEEATRPAVIEANGMRLALMAWTVWNKGQPPSGDGWAVAYLGNRSLAGDLGAEVARVKAETAADFLVLSLHWGWEYEEAPRTAQRAAARALIDAGADVVIGHHPHVVQAFERYRGGVIAYSLGNFLFDQTYRPSRRSVLLDLVLDAERGVVDARLHPLIIDGASRTPRPARSWARELAERAPGFEIVTP